jgi:hypothetical protein
MGSFVTVGVPAPRLFGRVMGEWPSCAACLDDDADCVSSRPTFADWPGDENKFWYGVEDEIVLYSLECE